ncbi:unnamed protein product [Auanema sp. JU1783]|nr:unnamed protein product [Auanema sp. JU1783]
MTKVSILAILLVGQAACASIGYGQLPTSNVQPAPSAYGAPAPSALPLAGHHHHSSSASHHNTHSNMGHITPGSPSSSPFLYNNEMTNSFPSQQWNSGFVPQMFQPSNMNNQYGALYQLPSSSSQTEGGYGGYGTTVHNIGGHPYVMYRQPFLPSTQQKSGTDHSFGAYEAVPEAMTAPPDSSVSVNSYGYNQGNVYERITTPTEPHTTTSQKKATVAPTTTTTTPSTILSSNDPWAAIAASNGLTKRQRFTI